VGSGKRGRAGGLRGEREGGDRQQAAQKKKGKKRNKKKEEARGRGTRKRRFFGL